METLEQQLIFTGGALLCAGIGSVQDVRYRRIPNIVTGPAIAAGLLLHTLVGGWRGLGDSALAGLIAGTVFLMFFLAGGMGAGDVKLMAAVGCLAGLSPLPVVVLATVIAGAFLALAVSFRQGRLRETLGNVRVLFQHHGRCGLRPHPDLNLANAEALRMPFALPIATGCLVTVFSLLWEARS